MKRVSAIALVVVSMVAAVLTGAIAQETDLVPAAAFPHETVGESYVPPLYYSVPQGEPDGLVPARDFPYGTVDLCYTPSLYYEASEMTAVQAMK